MMGEHFNNLLNEGLEHLKILEYIKAFFFFFTKHHWSRQAFR